MFIEEAKFDFHKFNNISIEEVEYLTQKFVEECYLEGYKTILIVTGKGLNSKNKAVIKPIVQATLKKHTRVEQYKDAESIYGGSGAIAIWLKTK